MPTRAKDVTVETSRAAGSGGHYARIVLRFRLTAGASGVG
jgi:hypothetical protein